MCRVILRISIATGMFRAVFFKYRGVYQIIRDWLGSDQFFCGYTWYVLRLKFEVFSFSAGTVPEHKYRDQKTFTIIEFYTAPRYSFRVISGYSLPI